MNGYYSVVISFMILLHYGRGDYDDEFRCLSRFDYEFKVVKKLAELESELEDQKQAVQKLTKDCDGRRSVDRVAFSAYLTNDMTSVPNQHTIIFDDVRTNIGNAYNGKTGIFLCRTPGVYAFYWVATNKDRTHMNTELVINGEEHSQAISDASDHPDYAVATNALIMELKSGDMVWIRSGFWHDGNLQGQNRTSFSGWKLYN